MTNPEGKNIETPNLNENAEREKIGLWSTLKRAYMIAKMAVSLGESKKDDQNEEKKETETKEEDLIKSGQQQDKPKELGKKKIGEKLKQSGPVDNKIQPETKQEQNQKTEESEYSEKQGSKTKKKSAAEVHMESGDIASIIQGLSNELQQQLESEKNEEAKEQNEQADKLLEEINRVIKECELIQSLSLEEALSKWKELTLPRFPVERDINKSAESSNLLYQIEIGYRKLMDTFRQLANSNTDITWKVHIFSKIENYITETFFTEPAVIHANRPVELKNMAQKNLALYLEQQLNIVNGKSEQLRIELENNIGGMAEIISELNDKDCLDYISTSYDMITEFSSPMHPEQLTPNQILEWTSFVQNEIGKTLKNLSGREHNEENEQAVKLLKEMAKALAIRMNPQWREADVSQFIAKIEA